MSKKIKVLIINPLEHPKTFYIEPNIKAFRKAVDANQIKHGEIEAKRLDKNIYAIFNKDRFLVDLQPNRRICDDIIVGTMLIVATTDSKNPISLTEEQASKYALRFWNTESFDDIDVVEANLNTLFARFLIDEE